MKVNKKINILYISHSPFYNGAEISLLNILKNINRSIFEPFVAFPGSGPLMEEIRKMGIKTFVLKIERWIRFESDRQIKGSVIQQRVQNIIEIIENNSIDIVHTNTSVIIEGAIAAKLKNKPHFWHIHEFLPKYTELKTFLPIPVIYKLIDYLSDIVITVSNYAASQFNESILASKIKIVYNGVEEIWKNIDKDELKSEVKNKIHETAFSVLSVGYLTENKGYKEWLETANIVRNTIPNIKFNWIGNANKKDLKFFRRIIRLLKLKNIVEYKGFSDDIKFHLTNSDILLCASRNEAFPMIILEAMSSKLPVIATCCGGTNESVINNETGFMVPINSPSEMSKKIIELYHNQELRNSFGENGFRLFKSKFEIKIVIEEIEKLYHQVVFDCDSNSISEVDKNLIKSLFESYDKISNLHWKSM
ncbi:MAG: glycosyltransferase family 4 protein [Ignavibacteria bacterium]|nr:glycosyltransferase family 4 protein [Ignavibacteria bacterium]